MSFFPVGSVSNALTFFPDKSIKTPNSNNSWLSRSCCIGCWRGRKWDQYLLCMYCCLASSPHTVQQSLENHFTKEEAESQRSTLILLWSCGWKAREEDFKPRSEENQSRRCFHCPMLYRKQCALMGCPVIYVLSNSWHLALAISICTV